MARNVREYLAECLKCAANRCGPPHTRFKVTETPNQPFRRVGVDLIGPLPLSALGHHYQHRYVLTAVCHLMGWAEAVPISDKQAATVWDAME